MASLQPEEGRKVAWSDKARIILNTCNCETAFFSLDCAEAAWPPNITIDGKRMFNNPFPVFLGVRYDRLPSFVEHVRNPCQSMSCRFNLERALGGMTLGWHSSDCRHGMSWFLHGTNFPLSQQSSRQLTRECHHPSRETFRF